MEMYIYGVHEIVLNGDRIWHTHLHKKFLLPNELKRDATPCNPIKFKLNEINLTNNDEFE
jgi:hypothetical protein